MKGGKLVSVQKFLEFVGHQKAGKEFLALFLMADNPNHLKTLLNRRILPHHENLMCDALREYMHPAYREFVRVLILAHLDDKVSWWIYYSDALKGACKWEPAFSEPTHEGEVGRVFSQITLEKAVHPAYGLSKPISFHCNLFGIDCTVECYLRGFEDSGNEVTRVHDLCLTILIKDEDSLDSKKTVEFFENIVKGQVTPYRRMPSRDMLSLDSTSFVYFFPWTKILESTVRLDSLIPGLHTGRVDHYGIVSPDFVDLLDGTLKAIGVPVDFTGEISRQ